MSQLESDDLKNVNPDLFSIIMTSLSIAFFYSLLSCGINNHLYSEKA